ncbi:hypothetical protein POSPLADRAFT_1062976 [Postia placenta MAD-698-R-SB12]|uniref:Uncharacterized protein n=1 Tax=Postia placenta MAD-698-R-SB12 TaxID=670580 RepID=A0A1X6MIC2_9APHY|nr:hypothetical protein POSPLADRAFT_1062976 [Postia placenta MAD-698-R-SB12]OSX56100.1 hypothetical protein POSPLADRAFT_1062976 [Postia placenta MAD-698-R-SB12]
MSNNHIERTAREPSHTIQRNSRSSPLKLASPSRPPSRSTLLSPSRPILPRPRTGRALRVPGAPARPPRGRVPAPAAVQNDRCPIKNKRVNVISDQCCSDDDQWCTNNNRYPLRDYAQHALRQHAPLSNRAIIAGSVVGVAAFVVLSLAMAVCYRRHQQKKPIFFRRSRPPPRNMLLASEDMDDYDLGPPMSSYRDTPGTGSAPSLASRATSYNAGSLQGAPLVPPAPFADQGRVSYSPHLMGMRTSESGSIFQEAVWPPPRSALVDPLLASSEDLSHIVDDVMGTANPSGGDSSPGSGAGAVRFPGSVATAAQATHARAPSEDPLMGSELESPSHSTRTPTWRSPLFVTNMGCQTASVRTAASPPPGARSRFSQGQSRPSHDDEGGMYAMGEAL